MAFLDASSGLRIPSGLPRENNVGLFPSSVVIYRSIALRT